MNTKLGNTSTMFEITIYARPHGARIEPVVARASFFDRYEAKDWATENEEKAKRKYGSEYDVYYRMKVLGSNAHISPPRSLSATCDRELSNTTDRARIDEVYKKEFRRITGLGRVPSAYHPSNWRNPDGDEKDAVDSAHLAAEAWEQEQEESEDQEWSALRGTRATRLSAICDRELRRVGLAEGSENKNKANKELAELSRRYHNSIPLTDITSILDRNGFDSSGVEGIYTGRDGRSNDKVGKNAYLTLSWHQMEETKRWEITAYIS
jgi:hypothetical protein